jgi:23S rRNA (pseudouridine1915-N3)-methyltransferase
MKQATTEPCKQRRQPTGLRALKINIHIRGKERGGESWTDEGCNEYEKRLKTNNIDITTSFHKTDELLVSAVEHLINDASPVVFLKIKGKNYSSEEFSEFCYNQLVEGGSKMSFVIGGAEGLPVSLLNKKESQRIQYVSLSELTLTHHMARLFLIEQIYRASEIHKGTKYHK